MCHGENKGEGRVVWGVEPRYSILHEVSRIVLVGKGWFNMYAVAGPYVYP